MSSPFHLAKWYLDCASPEGEVVIAYRAELRYHSLTLTYSSLLTFDDGSGVGTKTSLQASPAPRVTRDQITWSAPALGLEGTWRGPEREPVERTVFSSEKGDVSWKCLFPWAEVDLSLGGRSLHGLGYVEHLTLTVPPWAMPIDELRWGRFIGKASSLVWIDWRGPSSTQIVLEDGHPLAISEDRSVPDERGGSGTNRLASVEDERVSVPAMEIELGLEEPRVLRSGAIGSTALSVLPKRVRDAFPGRILGLDERKWRARGILRRGEAEPEHGWVIHEVVRWP